MAEPLVVGFRTAALAEFQRQASRDPGRRGRAALALAALLVALVVVPWVAVTVVQGFQPRSLVLLAFLVVPVALAVWGWRKLGDRPPVLGSVAFVVTDDEIRFEPYPSANSALGSAPAEVWPVPGTRAEVRRSAVVGERLVLRRPGSRRRSYPAATLDVPPRVVVARLAGS